MNLKSIFCALLALSLVATGFARFYPDKDPALKDAVILVIRHAEKPDSGYELSPVGVARAAAYVNYFKNYKLDGQPLKIDAIFATADSKGSHRPRLTVTPTAQALGLPIDSSIKDKDFQKLADELKAAPHGHVILIAWHHEEIPNLIHALGADADKIIPGGKWPAEVFGWVIQLRYDANGQLIEAKRIDENLMPDDSNKKTLEP